jgi:PAS domain S-box-containing protein
METSEMSNLAYKSNEQKAAEAEVEGFEDNRGPFVVAAEMTRMAMIFTDVKGANHPIIFANDAFLELTGYAREEVLAQDFNFMMANAADKASLSLINIEFQGGAKSGAEILYRRKDGSEFWSAVFICPVRDEVGRIVQYFASFVDLTKHKDELAESKKLINELNHRVKNTLATVQSIVWQALRSASDPSSIRKTIESRLLALSRSHDLLTRGNWKDAGLHDIISDSVAPFMITDPPSERIHIEGDNIQFPPKVALALGVAFNELATNAVKYGALSNAVGSITVRWSKASQSINSDYTLEWRETGGPLVKHPAHQGFGSEIIKRSLALELDGEVHMHYPIDGMVCVMNFHAPTQNIHG